MRSTKPVAVGAILVIGSGAAAALTGVVPQPPALAQPVASDGRPTPDACARLGYDLRDVDEERGYSGRVGMAVPVAPPMPTPPPPPPPPAAEALGLDSVVGTAQKRHTPSVQASPMAIAPVPGERPFRDTERYPDAQLNPVKQVAEEPVSTFSIDVDTAAYANVRRFLNDGRKPPRDAVRVEELVNYFDYDYPLPASRDEPFRPFVTVAPSPWSAGKQVIHIGLQGYELPQATRPPLNLVFLIDVSGSMSDESKLPLARKALNLLVDQMRPEDRVSVAVYAGAAGAVLPPTDGRQKLKIRCALEALHAGGSTAGGAGLALAYAMAQQNFRKDAVNRVILLTDGDFNVGVVSEEKLEDFVADKRKTGVYLSVYGFGEGNYNDVMMQTLAQSGNGTAAYVDTLDEARKLFRDDFSGSLFPIADDVKIQVEFNPARVAEYRLIGYETRLLSREDFNNDQVDAGEVGSGASVTALYEIAPVGGPLAVDPLRYQSARPPGPRGGELAFLKVRYKPPGGTGSRLIDRPIGSGDIAPSVAAAPEATRWALAVAAYGQKLRGDPWVPAGFGWSQVRELAQGARGEDPFGVRAEFVQLTRAAETGRAVNE